jgi:VanZ family protein
MLKHLRWALLWALFILVLCLIPGGDLPQWKWADLLSVDKLVHAGVFALLLVLLIRGLRGRYGAVPVRSRIMLFAILICIAYGGALEIMQGTLLVDRSADLLDFLANTMGCGLGWLWLRRAERKMERAGSAGTA